MIVHPPHRELGTSSWIDLVSPTPEEVAEIERATGLRVPSENEINEIESTSRLAYERGAFHLSTPLVAALPDGTYALTSVGFILSDKTLLTVRFAELPSFDAACARAETDPPQTAEEAFLRIFELIVDRSADKLERAGSECDDLSRSAFRSGKTNRKTSRKLSAILEQVGAVAERTSRVRDCLLGVGRAAAYVMESGVDGAPTVNAARMKAIRADVASLTEYEGHLANKIQFLLDATLGFINIEQNEIVKTLTIASVVGIPPVLIAGIYGMNFRNMPELNWRFGYPMALVLILVSALLPIVWFKRRGWM